MWSFISIALAMVVIVGFIVIFDMRKQNSKLMNDLESRMKKLNEQDDTIRWQQHKLEKNDEVISSQRNELRTKNADLQSALGAISQAERTISELQQKNNYDESAQKMKKLLSDLDEKYQSQNAFLSKIETSIRNKNAELEEKNVQFQRLQSYILTSQNEAAVLETKRDSLIGEIEGLNNQINDLKLSHMSVLRETMRERSDLDNDRGWVFYVGGREPQLRVLIKELIELYPELKKEFATIEWKKIWLPKIQDLCNKEGLDGKCGIYKLTVIGDESICYIGQAVNIKERWYDHIKKMVGVDSKGSEKLYEYGPDQLGWRVVEEVNRDKLNEREKYWIEFFGAKEYGLNKRLG